MAVKLNDGEFWLPADFLDDDFLTQHSRAGAEEEKVGKESDGRDYIAQLARRMAHTCLHEKNTFSISRAKPTLSEAGGWSADNAPPATLEQRENAWDLLYAAAGEVMRMREVERCFYERKVSSQPKKPFSPAKSSSAAGFTLPILTVQQLRASQFFQMKQQQLIKQQVAAAWNRHSKAAPNSKSRTTVFPPASAFSSFHRPHTLPVMTPLLLDGHVSRRASAGTGVFLPKQVGSSNIPRKNPASALQAIELEQRCNESYAADHEASPRRNQHQQQHCHSSPGAVSSHTNRLPPEWTY